MIKKLLSKNKSMELFQKIGRIFQLQMKTKKLKIHFAKE